LHLLAFGSQQAGTPVSLRAKARLSGVLQQLKEQLKKKILYCIRNRLVQRSASKPLYERRCQAKNTSPPAARA
jgi:hypothetical protein